MPGLAAINDRLAKYGLIIEGGVVKKSGNPDPSVSSTQIASATRVATAYLSRMASIELLEKDLANIKSLSRMTTPGAEDQAKTQSDELLSKSGTLGKEIDDGFKSSQGTEVPPLKAAYDKVKQYQQQAATLIGDSGQVDNQAVNAMSNLIQSLKDMHNISTENML